MKKTPASLSLTAFLPVLIWVLGLPAGASAYTPPAATILARVVGALSGAGSGQIHLSITDGDGAILEEKRVTVPLTEPDPQPVQIRGVAFRLPFYAYTLPRDRYPTLLNALAADGATVGLSRVGRDICFVLDGGPARLWVRKADSIPLRLELVESNGSVTRYEYIDPSPAGDKLLYPRRTVVTNGDTILFTESVALPDSSSGP